jgi:2-polyprenyl-3-methyl-5-hydroxy-6-metoxy-1,4-benzoquinol methylase
VEQDFWRNNSSLEHITPRKQRFPEGFDTIQHVREICKGRVLDFGCGDGRLVKAFEPSQYIGVDINAWAVKACRRTYPEYRFKMATDVLPVSDTALAYAVLLHVSDENIAQTIARLACAAPCVIVAEILGREQRRGRDGLPRVYQRDVTEYIALFAQAGMRLIEISAHPYNRYGGVHISFLTWCKVAIRQP